VGGVRFYHYPFVGYVAEHEPFRANEVSGTGLGDRERRPIGAGQYLNAQRAAHRRAHGAPGRRHPRDNFGADLAQAIGHVMHVFQDQPVEPGLFQCERFGDGVFDDRGQRFAATGRSGQGADVDHADQGAVRQFPAGGRMGHGLLLARTGSPA
jgi:hypothetical protein